MVGSLISVVLVTADTRGVEQYNSRAHALNYFYITIWLQLTRAQT